MSRINSVLDSFAATLKQKQKGLDFDPPVCSTRATKEDNLNSRPLLNRLLSEQIEEESIVNEYRQPHQAHRQQRPGVTAPGRIHLAQRPVMTTENATGWIPHSDICAYLTFYADRASTRACR